MDLGIGTGELLVIAAIALIVVGPKDLPVLMRKVGQFMARMRGMAAEFRASFDEMARQAELDELKKEVEALRQGRFAEATRADIEGAFRAIDQDLTTPGYSAPLAEHADEVAREAVDDLDAGDLAGGEWDPGEPDVDPDAERFRAERLV